MDFEFSSYWESRWEWEGLKVGNGVGVEVGVGVRLSDLRKNIDKLINKGGC